MSLRLEQADTPHDIPELTRLLWASFNEPLQTSFLILHPQGASREHGMKASTQRQLARNASDPTEHWLKVVDDATGAIVAAALYNFYETNPYVDLKHPDASWWPKGPQRDYVNEYLRIKNEPLSALAGKPHLNLKILFVHPEYRGHRLASRLLQWGIDQAEARNWEIWLRSWEQPKTFYEQRGFVVKREVHCQPTCSDPPQAWTDMDKTFQPDVKFIMMRPPNPARE